MEFLKTALYSIWDILNEMSPYLLLGFLIAGLMHAFIPGKMFSKYLSGNSFRAVTNAALFGIPLPLCSCGVIPTAMSLRKEGASKGAAVSFLVATPQTGVDSILATYSLMGLPFAILRPIAAFFTALFGGQMVNLVEKKQEKEDENINIINSDCSCGNCHEPSNVVPTSFLAKLKEAFAYAFGEMMEDIGKWLVVGIVIAGLISLIPNEFFAIFKDNTFASILLVLCLSIPMYLCATGSIPIAVALMLKGLTPGAALVMLMAGPASNMASIMVIGKVLGRRTLITYLSSIIFGAIAFALLIDFVLPTEWFLPTMMTMGNCCEEETSWFSIACSVLLICLLIKALLFHNHEQHHSHSHEESVDACTTAEITEFTIKGMNCSHCAENARKAIESVQGVEEVSVDLSSGKARIKGCANLEDICKAIESLGFSIIR